MDATTKPEHLPLIPSAGGQCSKSCLKQFVQLKSISANCQMEQTKEIYSTSKNNFKYKIIANKLRLEIKKKLYYDKVEI